MLVFYEHKNIPVSIREGSGMTFPPHLHSHIEIVYMLEGDMSVTINNATRILEAGGVSISLPNTVHAYATEQPNRFIILIFSPALIPYFQGRLLDCRCDDPFLPCPGHAQELKFLFETLLEESQKPGSLDITAAYINLLIALLLDGLTLTKKPNYQESDWFPQLLRFLSSHYTEKLTLDDMSRAVGISPYHLSRIFSEKIGYSVTQYLNQLRINLAVQQLHSTHNTITQICYECGYENVRSFNRAFKQIMGCSPSSLRARGPAAGESFMVTGGGITHASDA